MDGVLFNNLICNDYSRITSFPSADLTYTVSGIDDLSLTRFGSLPDAQHKYEQAAVLVYALANLPLVNAALRRVDPEVLVHLLRPNHAT